MITPKCKSGRAKTRRWGRRISLRAAGVSLLVLFLSIAIVTYVFADPIDLTAVGSTAEINGAVFLQWDPDDSAGSGTFNSFLRIQGDTTEQGYNTDGTLEFETKGGRAYTLAAAERCAHCDVQRGAVSRVSVGCQ